MIVSVEIVVDAHQSAGFTRVQNSDESCITFERGRDMCFHCTFHQSMMESIFVVEDDRTWNPELADQLERYFEQHVPASGGK
jgi:hypothetical protein